MVKLFYFSIYVLILSFIAAKRAAMKDSTANKILLSVLTGKTYCSNFVKYSTKFN